MKRILLLLLCLSFTLNGFALEKWREDANVRIEKHRKDDLEILVKHDDRPVAGADVELAMQKHEFLFGCNILKWGICESQEQNLEYNRRFAAVFNFANMPFFWWSYESEPGGKYLYSYSEDVASWCSRNNIGTMGHPLLWNWVDQPWAKDVDDEELYERQINRIKDCIERFGPKAEQKFRIETWDVVNEMIGYDREICRNSAPRLTEVIKKHGPLEVTKAAFEAARKANPNAVLIINDFETNEKYVDWLEKLVDEDGKPIYDAIGIQSHMHAGAWSNEYIWEVCERFAKFGKPLYFSELTILSSEKPFDWDKQEVFPSTPDGEAKQAEDAVRVYTILFSHPKIEMITWWDLSDQGAWMDSPAGLLHKDMKPKPAYEALRKLIKEEWSSDAKLQTDETGKINHRAFRGDYLLKIKLPDGKTKEFPITIKKGENRLVFEL